MDLSELKGIISLMQKSDLTELEIEIQDLKLRLARPGAGSVTVGNQAATEVSQQQRSICRSALSKAASERSKSIGRQEGIRKTVEWYLSDVYRD